MSRDFVTQNPRSHMGRELSPLHSTDIFNGQDISMGANSIKAIITILRVALHLDADIVPVNHLPTSCSVQGSTKYTLSGGSFRIGGVVLPVLVVAGMFVLGGGMGPA